MFFRKIFQRKGRSSRAGSSYNIPSGRHEADPSGLEPPLSSRSNVNGSSLSHSNGNPSVSSTTAAQVLTFSRTHVTEEDVPIANSSTSPAPLSTLHETAIRRPNMRNREDGSLKPAYRSLRPESDAYTLEEEMADELPDAPNLGSLVSIWGPKSVHAGPYSDVYKGHYETEVVAIKVLRAVGISLKVMRRKVQRERKIWSILQHRNILPLRGYTEEEGFGNFGALVSPWCVNGNLIQFITTSEVTALERVCLLQDVAEGIAYLHNHSPPLIHGDLKPENVLVDQERRALLCDFGLVFAASSQLRLDVQFKHMNTTSPHTGTARFLAPELVGDDAVPHPTAKSDIYAFGSLGLVVIFEQLPYARYKHNDFLIKQDIRRGIIPADKPNHLRRYSRRLWNFFQLCWNYDPNKRPDAAGASRTTGSIAAILRISPDLNDSVTGLSGLASHIGSPAPSLIEEEIPSLLELVETSQSAVEFKSSPNLNTINKMDLPQDLTGQVTTTDLIYQGVHSTVYSGTLKGQNIAVKIPRRTLHGPLITRRLRREIRAWSTCNHQNILPLLGISEGFEGFGAFISPWCENGNAEDYLQQTNPNQVNRMKLWQEVVDGVNYLHNRVPCIVHGNLQPENILINSSGSASIAGLGHALVFEGEGTGNLTTTTVHLEGFRYWAPEYLLVDEAQQPSAASDVYAIGCIGLRFVLDKIPYEQLRSPTTVAVAKGKGEPPGRPTQGTNALWSILELCWKTEKLDRPSCSFLGQYLVLFGDQLTDIMKTIPQGSPSNP